MPAWLRAALLAVSVIVLGCFDYLTGPDFGFSLFYMIPVAYAAWRSRGRFAVLLAVLSALAWFSADVPYHGIVATALWNTFTRLTMYVGIAMLMSRVRRDRQDLTSLNRQLESLLKTEQELSRTDSVTGLPNGRMFDDALRHALGRQHRDGFPMAIGYFDLDNFKRLNDTQGHAAGDEALKAVAAALTGVLRGGDIAARLGGDEFAVLFHSCDVRAADIVGGRLLEAMAGAVAPFRCDGLGATAGIACFTEPAADPREMMRAADDALYEGKTAGKGRLIVRSIPPPPGAAPAAGRQPAPA
jgi:diguanylate cyclase (GGDEF)-like protein